MSDPSTVRCRRAVSAATVASPIPCRQGALNLDHHAVPGGLVPALPREPLERIRIGVAVVREVGGDDSGLLVDDPGGSHPPHLGQQRVARVMDAAVLAVAM